MWLTEEVLYSTSQANLQLLSICGAVQHRTGWYNITYEHISLARRADTYIASVIRLNKYLGDQYSDSSECQSHFGG